MDGAPPSDVADRTAILQQVLVQHAGSTTRVVAQSPTSASLVIGTETNHVVDADGAYVDLPDQFACAYSESAEPTAEAIGDLICEALESAAISSDLVGSCVFPAEGDVSG